MPNRCIVPGISSLCRHVVHNYLERLAAAGVREYRAERHEQRAQGPGQRHGGGGLRGDYDPDVEEAAAVVVEARRHQPPQAPGTMPDRIPSSFDLGVE